MVRIVKILKFESPRFQIANATNFEDHDAD